MPGIGTILGGLVGIGLGAWLLQSYGLGRIFDVLGTAGAWGMLAVIAIHPLQMLCSALGWRAITVPPRRGLWPYFGLRWVREGVNNLLPLAQVGGEFVAARLLQQRGDPWATAIAGALADLSMETVSQIAFTLFGVLILLHRVGDGGMVRYLFVGLSVTTGVVAGCALALWFGFAEVVERAFLRLGGALGWAGSANVEGLNAALVSCYRSPRRVAHSLFWHLQSWLLGAAEVSVALHFLGHDTDLGAGLAIESVGQALKAAGFAVPGALGIQEGGYIVACHAFGLSPEVAIALSLLKRLREMLLGVPALIAWQRAERLPALYRGG